MQIAEIQRKVKKIESVKRDVEVAHLIEDKLFTDVLVAIASGADNPQELASEVLKSKEIDFPRLCS